MICQSSTSDIAVMIHPEGNGWKWMKWIGLLAESQLIQLLQIVAKFGWDYLEQQDKECN